MLSLEVKTKTLDRLGHIHADVSNLVFAERFQDREEVCLHDVACENLGHHSHVEQRSQAVQVVRVSVMPHNFGHDVLDRPRGTVDNCQLFEIRKRRLSDRIDLVFQPG